MLLLRQLQEMAALPVYVKGPLAVISNLMTGKTFGVNFESTYERCLLAQFSFVLASQLDLEPEDVAKQIDEFILANIALFPNVSDGVSLADLAKVLNHKTFLVNGKTYSLDFDIKYAHSANDVITLIKDGFPVIIPIDGHSSLNRSINKTNLLTNPDTDGIAKKVKRNTLKRNPTVHDTFHAYLAIGYDSQTKQVILRDTRSSYLLKGFVKVQRRDLDLYMHIGFAFDVKAKEVPAKLNVNDERYAIAS